MNRVYFLIALLTSIDNPVFAQHIQKSSSALVNFSTSCNVNPRTGRCEEKRKENKKSGGCFSGTAEVNLISGKKKMMKDVKIGDNVLTMSGTFQPIIGFLDRMLEEPTNFITLHTNLSSEVTLTESLVIFVKLNEVEKQSKYARDIALGDVLFHEETKSDAEVVQVSSSISFGYFAPLTDSGTLVVDGFLSSCYASYPHWIAHTAMYPARKWPAFFLGDVQEGPSTFVNWVKVIGNLVSVRNSAVTMPILFSIDAVKEEF